MSDKQTVPRQRRSNSRPKFNGVLRKDLSPRSPSTNAGTKYRGRGGFDLGILYVLGKSVKTLMENANLVLALSISFYILTCVPEQPQSVLSLAQTYSHQEISIFDYSVHVPDGIVTSNFVSFGGDEIIQDNKIDGTDTKMDANFGLSQNPKFGTFNKKHSMDSMELFLQMNGKNCGLENDSKSKEKTNAYHEAFQHLRQKSYSQSHAVELWKYCYMAHELTNHENINGYVTFIHGDGIFVNKAYIDNALHQGFSVAVELDQRPNMQETHGVLLFVINNEQNIQMMKSMAQFLVNSLDRLDYEPALSSQQFYKLIASASDSNRSTTAFTGPKWKLLKHDCDDGCGITNPNQQLSNPYCCQIFDTNNDVVFVTPHRYFPHQSLDKNSTTVPLPYAYGMNQASNSIHNNGDRLSLFDRDVLPYMTTIRKEDVQTKGLNKDSKSFYQILKDKGCDGELKGCRNCMKKKKDCGRCKDSCPCMCAQLCKKENQIEKTVSKVFKFKPPRYRKDGRRLIPRIVHQTWYEPVSKEKYPNFSRFVESWRQMGWEHKFYSDEASSEFLGVHFPPEVKEAYESISAGAFKADLFRYCVLFIYGGVYADVDVLLQSKLDMAIDDDVGFMTPIDLNPGAESKNRVCLWNGFLAAAPGHPFLAAAIETTVNNIRNRFTDVDVMNDHCPDVNFYLSYKFNVLFTTGPCMLGVSINKFLGRDSYADIGVGTPFEGDFSGAGRVVILQQDKEDMGAQRFTLNEKNMIVASTDFPGSDDRENVKKKEGGGDGGGHYSKLRRMKERYGAEGLYPDLEASNEWIKFEAVE